ncbi:MAG: hypothetical protein K0M45_06705 [Candidatus Paracaedibacteraceae bacterium]|nr:hypothetical protein [Candidatus Paracaedibacteraceae bacterium]
MIKNIFSILFLIYCLGEGNASSREEHTDCGVNPLLTLQETEEVSPLKVITLKTDSDASHLLFNIAEGNIKKGKLASEALIKGSVDMYNNLNKSRNNMPTRSATDISAAEPIFAGMCVNINFEESIHITASQQIRLSLSLCDTNKDAIFTTPFFGTDMFFVTAKGEVKILATQEIKGWLRGLILRPTDSFERSFTYMLRGDLDFNRSSTLENFLIVGASEIDFLIAPENAERN